MKSFIINVEMLFKMNTKNQGINNFDENKRQLVIPKYQREYQWSTDMIKTLLNDIKDKKKFIGIVILDQMDDSYEVVDGQQRLTTCFLTLAAIYNFYEKDPFERKKVGSLIEKGQRLVLENHSVGSYLVKKENRYELSINNDIYFQKEAFENAWIIITDFINNTLGQHEFVRSFRNKLLACEFLILINAAPEDEQSVEQVFLDINEKSKILNPADIFKGHCFELFDKEFHDSLKDKWAKVKGASKKFEKNFRYRDTSWFLYMYLLMEGKINENLSIPNSGRHYLQGKEMVEVDGLLDGIINYGEVVSKFYSECKDSDYYFETVCKDSYEHRNTNEVSLMKKMSLSILEVTSSKAQFQKIPFMYFISKRAEFVNSITHDQVRRIVTNLYCYAILFEASTERKSKDDIDRTVIANFKDKGTLKELVKKTKILRDAYVAKFVMAQERNKFEKLSDLYSLMDFYDVKKGIITEYYSKEKQYSLEHFVVNDNNAIEWIADDKSFVIHLDEGESKKRKKRTINYILIDKDLNADLKSFDIVTKIEEIGSWHEARKKKLPKHIKIIFDLIQKMDEFKELQTLKANKILDEELIRDKYIGFLNKYFDDATDMNVREALTSAFKGSFQDK